MQCIMQNILLKCLIHVGTPQYIKLLFSKPLRVAVVGFVGNSTGTQICFCFVLFQRPFLFLFLFFFVFLGGEGDQNQPVPPSDTFSSIFNTACPPQ